MASVLRRGAHQHARHRRGLSSSELFYVPLSVRVAERAIAFVKMVSAPVYARRAGQRALTC